MYLSSQYSGVGCFDPFAFDLKFWPIIIVSNSASFFVTQYGPLHLDVSTCATHCVHEG